MKGKEKVIYFTDELNDEFSTAKITPKKIDGKFKYLHKNPFWYVLRFVLYRLIAIPFGWLFLKLKFHHKIKNRQVLKQARKTGAYIYGNHTQASADPFVPTMLTFPKSAYLIVHPSNVSIKGVGWAMPYLGALPLPDDITATRHFMEALNHFANKNKNVVIYPEAHIWPYYTGIRPFKSTSFKYPIKFNKPVFCFTNTYQKRGKKVKMVTYVDGPFYPDKKLSLKEQEQDLRNQVYEQMTERSKLNNIDVIKYIRKNEKEETND